MTIYMTTELQPNREGRYRCEVWAAEPDPIYAGTWFGGDEVLTYRLERADLATLGFPPPGNVRILKTGPCEEGE